MLPTSDESALQQGYSHEYTRPDQMIRKDETAGTDCQNKVKGAMAITLEDLLPGRSPKHPDQPSSLDHSLIHSTARNDRLGLLLERDLKDLLYRRFTRDMIFDGRGQQGSRLLTDSLDEAVNDGFEVDWDTEFVGQLLELLRTFHIEANHKTCTGRSMRVTQRLLPSVRAHPA